MRDERGFTLIELLIVVAIIAILAAILIPNFLRARAQSQLSASKGNLKNLATSLESYFVDRGSYPTALAGLTPIYLRAVPNDPCSNLAYTYDPLSTPAVPTDYKMSIDFPAGSPCDNIVPGLSYTPGGGLQETP
ncbi:MAG: prepilin-type N-terminal cleavage/methylation domain-containing protein [Armatimonadetes bacterium]|nr:prepilin-type N-terminal cleavage/methylation domain-containing protein [Armatimonadota bacterium]